MAKSQKQGRGLPKRVFSTGLKISRANSWSRSQVRKALRRAAQEKAHARNVKRGYTAWEEVKRMRLDRRAGV